jgi:polysaccharide export outer membrane protein
MRPLVIVVSASLFLAGCGLVYTSPSVNDGKTENGINVDVVSLTFNSADFANRLVPYSPRPLPAPLKVYGAPTVASPAMTDTKQNRRISTRWPEPLPVQSYRLGVGDSLLFSPPGGSASLLPGSAQSGLIAASASRQLYTVQDDGSISIPDIGRIRVQGLTLPQVEQAIFQALLERQKDPSFSVEIAEFNSQRVDVSGLVVKPTSLPIALAPLYLREALSAAGGSKISNVADVVVTLYRDGETYRMMLSDIYSETTLGRQVLKDGDSIFVDSLYFGDRTQDLALSSDRAAISSQIEMGAYPQDNVYLVGEVKKQLRISLPFEQKAKLADILFNKDAGGFDLKTASVSQIYVLRFSQLSGRVTAYHLNAKNVGSLVVATALEMRPNDFVFIAEQPITAWNRVIQQFVPSLFVSVANAASG